jgi:predicted phosphodiesterase
LKVSLKIAVISDIHANLRAFEAVVEDLTAIDAVLCLGDIVGYGPQPNEVMEKLRQLRPGVILLGNHDYAVSTGDSEGFSSDAAAADKWTRKELTSENLQFLSTLRPSSALTLSGFPTRLFHGSPRDPLGEYIYPGIQNSQAEALIVRSGGKLLLLGHTHMPMIYSLPKGTLVNPGSVGQPRDGDPRASYAIITLSDDKILVQIKRVKYDIDSVAEKILGAGLPRLLADRLYVGE